MRIIFSAAAATAAAAATGQGGRAASVCGGEDAEALSRMGLARVLGVRVGDVG